MPKAKKPRLEPPDKEGSTGAPTPGPSGSKRASLKTRNCNVPGPTGVQATGPSSSIRNCKDGGNISGCTATPPIPGPSGSTRNKDAKISVPKEDSVPCPSGLSNSSHTNQKSEKEAQIFGGGGLFGSNPTSMGGAAAPATSTPSFGGSGATTPGSSAFGALKPTGSVSGSTSVTSSGSLFGTNTSQTLNTGSSIGFGSSQTPFGIPTTEFAQPQAVGPTVKFNPLTGTDAMMKSSGQQSITTRHQCIACMKEYENKSLEELRFEDYSENRKGPSDGSTIGGGGLFNSTMPTAQPQQQTQLGDLIGQPSKPLFGTATTSAFDLSAASPFNTATSAIGETIAGSTGLFSSKPAGFEITTTPSTSFGFNQTSTNAVSNQDPVPGPSGKVNPSRTNQKIEKKAQIFAEREEYLNWLPDIPVLKIASFLKAKDLASFSSCCKNVYNICQGDGKVWKDVLKLESPEYWQDFMNMAESILERQTLIATDNFSKLALVMYNRTEQNWASVKQEDFRTFDVKKMKGENFSSHLVVLHIYSIGTIHNRTRWSLNILDLRTGIEKRLNRIVPLMMGVRSYTVVEYTLFNDKVILHTPGIKYTGDPCCYICFQFDMEQGTLQEVWRSNYPKNSEFSYHQPFPNMFKFFHVRLNKAKDRNGFEMIFLECFSNEDGSKLCSHRYNDTIRTHWYWQGCNDDSGWFVYNELNELKAINYKHNSIKVLTNIAKYNNGNIHLFIKYQKLVLTSFDTSQIELFDLCSGSLLLSITSPCHFFPFFDLDIYNNVTIAHQDLQTDRVTVKVFSKDKETTLNDYQIPRCKNLILQGFWLGRCVCFEELWANKRSRLWYEQLCSKEGGDSSHRTHLITPSRGIQRIGVRSKSKYSPEIVTVHPFYIVMVKSNARLLDKLTVLDFLKLDQYLK